MMIRLEKRQPRAITENTATERVGLPFSRAQKPFFRMAGWCALYPAPTIVKASLEEASISTRPRQKTSCADR